MSEMYTGAGYSGMKGSVFFVLKFALPPFSPPFPPLECKFQNKTCTEPLTQEVTSPLYMHLLEHDIVKWLN